MGIDLKLYKDRVKPTLDYFLNGYTDEEIKLRLALTEEAKVLTKLQDQVAQDNAEELLALQWDHAWPRSPITYVTEGKHKHDVRNLVLTKSYILRKVLNRYTTLSNDDKALAILKYVGKRIKYVSDSSKFNMPEFWQNPELTFQDKTGDCEDGALLIISLLRLLDVPAYKLKVCAGWVQDPRNKGKKVGHAYVIYLAEDENWYVLDWCYWFSESVKAFKKKRHSLLDKYEDIWWTFNDQHTWTQKNTTLGK